MKNVILLIATLAFQCSFAYDYSMEIIVAKDGTGDFQSIQAAINATKAFPDSPIRIFIKAGTYIEKVQVYEWNTRLSIIGDTLGKTIIAYDDYFDKINRGRNSTFHTATLKIEANDLYAANLIIQNTSGDIGQAIALHINADRVFFNNCAILGYQDTMYLTGENNRQYFKDCQISGSTDFIFGSATALFDGCVLISRKSSYITAASTAEQADYGFIFMHCKLTGDNIAHNSTYLGRPWRSYAKTVFINCEMGAHIHSAGWKVWHNDGEVFYAEFESKGAGGKTAKRVDWSFQLTKEQAADYSIDNVFDGWIPTDK